MEITFDNEFEYIPVFNNNRKKDKPMVARFRYLTTPEREKFIKSDTVIINGVARTETKIAHSGILKASLLSLTDCVVNKVAITNAKELLAYEGLSQLCVEMGDYAAGKNITPDLKN